MSAEAVRPVLHMYSLQDDGDITVGHCSGRFSGKLKLFVVHSSQAWTLPVWPDAGQIGALGVLGEGSLTCVPLSPTRRAASPSPRPACSRSQSHRRALLEQVDLSGAEAGLAVLV